MRSAWLWLQPEAFSKPFSSQDRQTPPINLSAFRLQERKHKNRSDEAAEWLCSRHHISFLTTRQRQTGLMIKHNQPFILWDLVCCDISNTVTTLLPSWRLKTVFIAGMRLTLERTDDSSGNTDESRYEVAASIPKILSAFQLMWGWKSSLSSFHFQTRTAQENYFWQRSHSLLFIICLIMRGCNKQRNSFVSWGNDSVCFSMNS